MNGLSRRKIEMGRQALEWSLAHMDPSPGYNAAVSRLQERVSRADQLADQQRDGILVVRKATARKRQLQRRIKEAHLSHLVHVAQVASEEEPDLAEKFVMPGRITTYSAFRTAARGLMTEAESRKELLVKHGLSETLLEDLKRLLDEFDEAVEQGALGRALHVGASFELAKVANEVVQIVNALDGLNRFRFSQDGELLSAWEAISNVVSARRPETKPSEEGKPAPGGAGQPAA